MEFNEFYPVYLNQHQTHIRTETEASQFINYKVISRKPQIIEANIRIYML